MTDIPRPRLRYAQALLGQLTLGLPPATATLENALRTIGCDYEAESEDRVESRDATVQDAMTFEAVHGDCPTRRILLMLLTPELDGQFGDHVVDRIKREFDARMESYVA